MDGANPSNLSVQLWYGDLLVAEVSNAIVHQGTWFGDYRPVISREQGKKASRVCDYISFDEKFHKRLKQGKNLNPDQFDPFKDVLYSGVWRVRFPDGGEMTLAEGPGFVAGEACWNHPMDHPSREQAAWEEWCRRTHRPI